jgi:putative flavoprotein involved in K+ transport
VLDERLDVVVIGAGHAGLGISYLLRQQGISHAVFERGTIGESWRTQRWDSFALNTPNKVNVLPGDVYEGPDPDGFESAKGFVAYLQSYARRFRLPVHEHAPVVSVESHAEGFRVIAENDDGHPQVICKKLVVASGAMNRKQIPPFARHISPAIRQYHASEYRNPSQLEPGHVLVVGSGQSGLQVAEDLLQSGRTVYLSTSAVGRVRRRYRGLDIVDWLMYVGFFDAKADDVTNPADFQLRQPQVSGVGPRGHTHSLQSLAARGMIVLGTLESADGMMLRVQPNATDHVQFADAVSARIKLQIEDYIAKSKLNVPQPESDPADEPDAHAACASPITSLDLQKAGIRSIVWTTGFAADYSYLKFPVLDGAGRLMQRNCVAKVPGLYFLGMPWLHKRKSGIICGVPEDAELVAHSIRDALRRTTTP